jgi:hypothetical protein
VQELWRDLSRVVLATRGLDDVLGEVTDIAARSIPGAESTSITLVRGDRAFTAAHTGEMALAADELQYERGYGPCMDGRPRRRRDPVLTTCTRAALRRLHTPGRRPSGRPELAVDAAALPGQHGSGR